MRILNTAIEMYLESIDQDDANPLAYLRLGWAYVMKNQIYDGYNYLKKGLKVGKNSLEILVKLAEVIMMMNDERSEERRNNALEYVTIVLDKQPENVDALIIYGRIMDKEGKLDESYNAFEKYKQILVSGADHSSQQVKRVALSKMKYFTKPEFVKKLKKYA